MESARIMGEIIEKRMYDGGRETGGIWLRGSVTQSEDSIRRYSFRGLYKVQYGYIKEVMGKAKCIREIVV